jgi:hypothetical protein
MTTKPSLKRELGLRDLTLFAVTCIVSARWIPIAAHAGPGSVTLWFLAAVLFMVPLTVAVAALVAKCPRRAVYIFGPGETSERGLASCLSGFIGWG